MSSSFPARPRLRLFCGALLGATVAGLAACTDQTAPSRPRAIQCTSGIPTNAGTCVAPRSAIDLQAGARTSITADATALTEGGTFTEVSTPDAAWTGSTSSIDISSIANSSIVTSVTDGHLTVGFSAGMSKAQAVVEGGGWATWSCPPDAESCTPHVLTSNGAPSVTMSLSRQVFAFGFEIEPNPFETVPITVQFVLSSGGTVVGVIAREINGNAGARLMAGRSTVAFDRVTIVSNTDFAIAQLRYSATTSEAYVPAGEGATVVVTENGQAIAGIDVPEGTFSENVTLTTRLVSTDESAPCHAYLLGQVGRCLQITALTDDGEKAVNQQPMTAGLCAPTNVGPLELFKFEDPHGTPFALQQAMVPFLDCAGFQTGSTAPDGSLRGLAMGVVKRVGGWLSPTPLYAAHGGFGGKINLTDGLSFFSWASPMQVSTAGLAANVLRSGKDLFVASGTFDMTTSGPSGGTGFTPGADAVTVAIGKSVSTIPAGSFQYSARLRQWLYAARSTTGITAMSIDPVTGRFTVAATVPTGGPLPISKPFSLNVGHRTQGLLLLCSTRGTCIPQEPR